METKNVKTTKKVVNEWQPNEKQKKVIDFLSENRGTTFTLAEISEAIGEQLKSGTTNVLINREIVTSHPEARLLECPCCGHKRKVATYEINTHEEK